MKISIGGDKEIISHIQISIGGDKEILKGNYVT